MHSHAITCDVVKHEHMQSRAAINERQSSQEAITRGNHKRQSQEAIQRPSRGHQEAIKRQSVTINGNQAHRVARACPAQRLRNQWQSMAIRLTGLLVPARRSACAISPGSAPTYVRRCPRMSAASETPPSEMRSNLRPSAFAMDLPSEVFPTPGGPTRHLMREAISEGHQRGSSVITQRIGPRADEGGNQRGSSLTGSAPACLVEGRRQRDARRCAA